MAPDWDALPEGVMIEIAERIGSYDDFNYLEMVSRRWRSARRMAKYGGRSPQVPWLLLCDDYWFDHVINSRFYSLSKNDVVRKTTPPYDIKNLFSSRGWLMTVSKEGAISLLNPLLSGDHHVVHLPDTNSFGYFHGYYYPNDPCFVVGRFALSCSPTMTSDLVPHSFHVMIIDEHRDALAVWTPGESVWTPVVAWHLLETCTLHVVGWHLLQTCTFHDVAYCGGEFFAITSERDLVACKVNTDVWESRRCKTRLDDDNGVDNGEESVEEHDDLFGLRFVVNLKAVLVKHFFGRGHLVVFDDDDDKLLLVVIRHIKVEDGDGYTTHYSFAVIEIDIKKGEFTEVKDLGNKSIFLGNNEGLCTRASSRYGCKPNRIYFSEDTFGITDDAEDMGIFNLADGTVEHPYIGKPFVKIDPYLWIEPRV